jgi:hypothetical protein
LGTLVAHSGTYTTEGDKWTTSVEVAWNPEWVGTKQVRILSWTVSDWLY